MSPCVFMIRSSTVPSTPSSSGMSPQLLARLVRLRESERRAARADAHEGLRSAQSTRRIGARAATFATQRPSATVENHISRGNCCARCVVEELKMPQRCKPSKSGSRKPSPWMGRSTAIPSQFEQRGHADLVCRSAASRVRLSSRASGAGVVANGHTTHPRAHRAVHAATRDGAPPGESFSAGTSFRARPRPTALAVAARGDRPAGARGLAGSAERMPLRNLFRRACATGWRAGTRAERRGPFDGRDNGRAAADAVVARSRGTRARARRRRRRRR